MFDPHHLRRRNHNRYARRGQVIQARAVDPPTIIDINQVDKYQQFLEANGRIADSSQVRELRDQVNDLTNQNIDLNTTVQQLDYTNTELNTENNTLRQTNTQLSNQVTEQASTIKTLNATVTSLETINTSQAAQITELENTNDELEQTNQDLTSQVSTLTTENTTLSNRVTALTNTNQTLTSENNTLKSQNSTLTSENSTLKSQNESLTTQNTNLVASVNNYKGLYTPVEPTLTKITGYIQVGSSYLNRKTFTVTTSSWKYNQSTVSGTYYAILRLAYNSNYEITSITFNPNFAGGSTISGYSYIIYSTSSSTTYGDTEFEFYNDGDDCIINYESTFTNISTSVYLYTSLMFPMINLFYEI